MEVTCAVEFLLIILVLTLNMLCAFLDAWSNREAVVSVIAPDVIFDSFVLMVLPLNCSPLVLKNSGSREVVVDVVSIRFDYRIEYL